MDAGDLDNRQRWTAKVPFATAARLQIVASTFGYELPAETVDISVGGAQVVAVEDLAVHTAVRLRCVLPSQLAWSSVDLQGIVTWRKPMLAAMVLLGRGCFRYRLRFEELTASDELKLVRAVDFIEAERAGARRRPGAAMTADGRRPPLDAEPTSWLAGGSAADPGLAPT